MADVRRAEAARLMTAFLERTSAAGGVERRYLWTDAFAVCNLLALAHATGEGEWTERALRLIDRVHHTLGRHRSDDPRRGWLAGLDERAGEARPTCGGLRIGKPLPERRPDEPMDERLEWDRDGQYFHYLTKWMHALDQTGRATGYPVFHGWACELAQMAHHAFTYASPGGRKRMYWKMSIDLTRPLVPSMGQHDPLDGLVTCLQLGATADSRAPSLAEATADFCAMVDPRALATDDPLGIGGLLADACRLQQLGPERTGAAGPRLLDAVLAAAAAGLRRYAGGPQLRWPAGRRLAFRELGLAIGLAGVRGMGDAAADLAPYTQLGAEIEAFWLHADHRRVDTWLEHADINDVMLATSLVPGGFLVLRHSG